MLLYTLLDENEAGGAADATGLSVALGFRPSRICVPLDPGSLTTSWMRMATAAHASSDLIEVLLVDDADAVPVDAVRLRRALARASRDGGQGPDPDAARRMLKPTSPACTDYALPGRFNARTRLCMSAEVLASGEPDDYVTNMDTLSAVCHAASGVGNLVARGMPLRAALMLTGIAAFVWGQATRTDLSRDIIWANFHYLPDMLHVEMALMLLDDATGEHASREAYLLMQTLFVEGLDELANLLARYRASRSDTTDDMPCFCGSGIPYVDCCRTKTLDEIARAW